MTTRTHDHVVVDASGLVRVCAWCVPPARLAELNQQHRCSHSLCPACAQALADDLAAA